MIMMTILMMVWGLRVFNNKRLSRIMATLKCVHVSPLIQIPIHIFEAFNVHPPSQNQTLFLEI